MSDDQMKEAEKHFNRGRAFSLKGRNPEAIKAYKKALEIDPCHTQARINLKFICYFNRIGIGNDQIKNVAKTGKLRKSHIGQAFKLYKSPSLFTFENSKLLGD